MKSTGKSKSVRVCVFNEGFVTNFLENRFSLLIFCSKESTDIVVSP